MEQQQIDQSLRLSNLIKALNVNQSEFAKTLGMAQPNISRILNGGAQVSIELVNKISNAYKQVNLHWLLTGDGEMFLDGPQAPSPADESSADSVPQAKRRLEILEERVEQLEKIIRKGGKDFGK